MKPASVLMMGLAAACWLGVDAAWAASGNADGTYTVTVTKIEASTDGTTFVTLFEGSQAVNIASADAGATAAALVSGVRPPDGTYTTIRTTIGANLLLKGYVNNGSTTIFTSGGTDSGAFTTNSSAADTPGSTYAVSTFTVPPGNRTNNDTSVSIPVSGDAAHTVKIKFDTSGVITQSAGIPAVGSPLVSVSAN